MSSEEYALIAGPLGFLPLLFFVPGINKNVPLHIYLRKTSGIPVCLTMPGIKHRRQIYTE